jgi:hypothetical protein
LKAPTSASLPMSFTDPRKSISAGSTAAMLVRSRAEKTSRASCSALPATPPEMEILDQKISMLWS